ncbi:hypothetical protein AAG906_017131 [Vitis piasezkii]
MPCEAPTSGWRFPSHEYPLTFISYLLRAIVLQVEEMTYIIKRAFMRFSYPFCKRCYTIFPSSKVKFIRGHIITIQSIEILSLSSDVHIDHGEDDLHLTGFTFDEGPHEFTFTIDHDMPYRLGYIPTEADARYMSQLRRDRVRARMSGIPFDYPLRPYTFQLADYFIRGSEHTPRTKGLFTFQRQLRFRTSSRPWVSFIWTPGLLRHLVP